MKYIRPSLILFTLILMLTACSSERNEPNVTEKENVGGPISTEELVPENILKPKSEDIEAAAESLLYSAFSFEANEIPPTIMQDNGISSLRYLKDPSDPSDFFVVDFYEEFDFPMTLYHFCHSNEEEQSFIENEEDFLFDTEMEKEARAFVERVYGVDCSGADAHAFGYANKVSVQLDVSEDVIFQVRFYYKETTPVGVLFFTDEETAKEAMDTNNAVRLYTHRLGQSE